MNFDTYQESTAYTAIYPGQGELIGLLYCALGLGEAGEVQGEIKRVLRDNGGVLDDKLQQMIEKELGDLLYYVARVAAEARLNLSDIARLNLDKLADRKERGVLKGRGGDR